MTQKLIFSLLLLASAMFGQLNTFTSTTLSVAATSSTNVFVVASATNITAGTTNSPGSSLYVLDPGSQRGELVRVTAVNGTRISVIRNQAGTIASGHIVGAVVLVQTGTMFEAYDPNGGCTLSQTKISPWINVTNGRQWLCSTVTNTWVPGFQSDLLPSATATVASAASAITPSGPLFSVSGTAAITGLNLPVGFVNGSITIIPTAIFTWTAAGNIAIAGTAVVNRAIVFTWNAATSRWVPSYV